MIGLYFIIALLPFTLFSLKLNRVGDRSLAIFFASSYVLFFGLAYKFGVDWFEYERAFLSPGENYFEIGYVYLSLIFENFGFNYYYFQFFVKIIFWYLYLKIIFKYSSNFTFSVFLAFLMSFVFLNDVVRQQFAAVFVFCAFLKIDKGFYFYISLALLGALFHVSALMVIPLYFLYKRDGFRKIFIYFIFVAFILSLVKISWFSLMVDSVSLIFGDLIGGRLSFYKSISNMDLTLGRMIRFFIFIFVVYQFEIVRGKDFISKYKFIYSAFIIMIGYEIIFYDVIVLWARSREYFVIFFPMVFFALYSKGLRFFISNVFLLVYGAYSFYGFYSNQVFFENYSKYNNIVNCQILDCVDYELQRNKMIDAYWGGWAERKIERVNVND